MQTNVNLKGVYLPIGLGKKSQDAAGRQTRNLRRMELFNEPDQ
jgi:hypothetical protein